MFLENYLNGFKRYALYEKQITPKVIKSIISTTTHLFQFAEVSDIVKMNTVHIREYLYTEKEKRLWSSKTFRNKRQHLKTFFNYCCAYDYIKINPVDKITKPKLAKTLPRFIETRDLLSIIAHTDLYPWRYDIERVRNKAIISTFLFTGIRLNELLNLHFTDINIEEQEITIKKGKGDKERIVPIHVKLFTAS